MARRFRPLALLTALATLLSLHFDASHSAAVDSGPSEYQVKAAYLYNFASYVEWPESSFASPSNAITLCVIADETIEPIFRKIPKTTTLNKPLDLRYYTQAPRAKDLESCHILFSSLSFKEEMTAIEKSLKGQPVLTVNDESNDSMVNFVITDNKIKFAINLQQLKSAGIKVSSQLLKLAVAVEE